MSTRICVQPPDSIAAGIVSAGDGKIELVRGDIGVELGDEVLAFWAAEKALDAETARRRLPEVVAVARDASGAIVGVASAYPDEVPLIERRFWVLRNYLRKEAAGLWPNLVNEVFTALERDYLDDREAPIGLCLFAGDAEQPGRGREVVWPDTEMMLAGVLDDGRQIRIRYFDDAIIGPGYPNSPALSETRDQEYPIEAGYRVERFGEGEATPEDVLELWRREGVVPEAEAQRRVHEVQLVAIEDSAGVVGVSTAYLQRTPQLRMDLWIYRTFVAEDHRKANLAAQLIFGTRDRLQDRFLSGEDTRAAGVLFELENEGLRRYFNRGLWLPADFSFIGETERGAHLRVHYFPGATVP
jgi:hypothetical protein